MKKSIFTCSLLCGFLLIFNACKKDVPELLTSSTLNLPATTLDYSNPNLPDFIAFNNNAPFTNPTTDEGATLGRVLFYEKALSLNNKISCGSCHEQSKGFSDGKAFSEGFDGNFTTRSSMSLVNLGYINGPLFWDQRSANLEVQALQPVKNHIEMGIERMEALETKLAKIEYYPALFKDAYGTEEITAERIANAMAQFMRSIVSYRSKFDQQQRPVNITEINQ